MEKISKEFISSEFLDLCPSGTIKNSSDIIVPVKGNYDQIISKFHELDEGEMEEIREKLPEFAITAMEWNWQMLGNEGRNWLRNTPSFIRKIW
jgi:hypothetical protein